MDYETIKSAWLEVFPHGHCTGSIILGDLMVSLYIQTPSEWVNGISHNDPLHYVAGIEDDLWHEDGPTLAIKTEDKRYFCQHISIRKQNIKSVTKEKLIKRFQKIKAIVESNKENIIYPVNI